MTSSNDSKIHNVAIGLWFTVAISIVALVMIGLFGYGTFYHSVEPHRTKDLVIIIPSEEVSRLPGRMTMPFLLNHAPVSLSDINTSDTFDAVIISRITLDNAHADSVLRDTLINMARNGHILLVYDASPGDLVAALTVKAPLVTASPNTVYLLSSIVFVHDVPIIGNIVVSPDNPSADDLIGRDIQVHVERTLLTIKELEE